MYFIFGHAKDLSFRIFPQAQEQFSGILSVQKFLPRNRLDLIQVDHIEPSESLHRFQMCFNKAILFHSFMLFIPSPPSFFGRHTWSQASCSPIYNSQPISLMLLTSRTTTTLLVVAKTPRVACGAGVVGTAWVVVLAMPSITILTI